MASPLRKLFDNPMSYSPEQDARLAQVQQLQEAADPWLQRRQAREQAMVAQDPLVQEELQNEREYEMAKAVAPARMQGEYAVRAAEARGQQQAAQVNNLLSLLRGGQEGGGIPPGGRVSIPGVGSISTPAAKPSQIDLANKAALQKLMMGGHAPRPAGESAWSRMAPTALGGGPSQRDIDQREMNRLLMALGGGQQQEAGPAAMAEGGVSREAVAAALQAQGYDPAEADAVMADPEALAELGF